MEVNVELRHLNLLDILNNAQGNILHDEKIICNLEHLQTESNDFSKKSSEADKIMKDVITATEGYVQFSHLCADLFFAIDRLSSLHHSYHFSLEWFLDVFKHVITDAKETISKNVTTRLEQLQCLLYQSFFQRLSSALSQKHRASFLYTLFESDSRCSRMGS
jgi:dynein heavy chain 1